MSKFLILATIFWQTGALGAADCKKYPKKDWIPEDQFKKRLVDAGYTIKDFHVDGNCYEMYGVHSGGGRHEIYFDTKTGAKVKFVDWTDK